MRRGLPRRASGLLAALVALGASACDTHPAPPLSPATLARTRRFSKFPIFWAGPRFEGIPLTAADLPRDYDESLGMRVYYGDCPSQGFLGGGGCTLPLEINTVIYKPHSNVELGRRRTIRIHGVPAVAYDGGRSIELYTGDLAIDVFADSPARALRAARALRPLSGPARPATLPPPDLVPGVAPPNPIPLHAPRRS